MIYVCKGATAQRFRKITTKDAKGTKERCKFVSIVAFVYLVNFVVKR
jgi:hypothetical protein